MNFGLPDERVDAISIARVESPTGVWLTDPALKLVYMSSVVKVKQHSLNLYDDTATIRYPIMWRWLKQNCKGGYRILQSEIEFELKDDATQFYITHA